MCWNFEKCLEKRENTIHLLLSSPRGHSFVNTWQRLYLFKYFQTSGQKKKIIMLGQHFMLILCMIGFCLHNCEACFYHFMWWKLISSLSLCIFLISEVQQ